MDTFICASVFHSSQTMTNRCISSLIAGITNEMPYELPGLPPRNESPGQFAWKVIELPAVRERGDVPRITAQSASLRVRHEKPFSSTECQGFALSFTWSPLLAAFPIHSSLSAGPVDGSWMGLLFGGPRTYGEMTNHSLSWKTLRTATEGSERNGSLWECGTRWTAAVQFSKAGLRNIFGRQWDVNVIMCYQHVQAECADEGE